MHKEITIPLSLIIAGMVLPNLLPGWETLGKILPASQEYKWTIRVIKASIGVIVLLFPYFVYARFINKGHADKQIELFKSAIKTINTRSRITLNLINEFKTTFYENKYFINKKQRRLIENLLSDLQELRICTEERKGDITGQERKTLVGEERQLLNRIESMKSTIEKYLSKIK